MKCPDNGTLRTYLDGEMEGHLGREIEQHLRSCASCHAVSERIAAQRSRAGALLSATASGPAVNAIDAYREYQQRFGFPPDSRLHVLNRFRQVWNRPAWGAAAAVFAFVALLSFAPARTWGQKILQMLRVQKVAVVPVDLSVFNEEGSRGAGRLFAQLVSDNVVVTMKPGPAAVAADVDQASQLAGFKVRALSDLGEPRKITVTDEGAFHMTLDRDRIQAVLDQVGRSDIQIPANVDGSTIAVHVPKMVSIRYGSCMRDGSVAPDPDGTLNQQPCLGLMEVPSPTVSVPPSLDIASVAEAGLQIAGMSAAEAHSFTKSVDWSSTLVIPIPQNGSSYMSVPVDGVTGTLIQLPERGKSQNHYMLMWVKNGIIYSIAGGGKPDQALAAAAALS